VSFFIYIPECLAVEKTPLQALADIPKTSCFDPRLQGGKVVCAIQAGHGSETSQAEMHIAAAE